MCGAHGLVSTNELACFVLVLLRELTCNPVIVDIRTILHIFRFRYFHGIMPREELMAAFSLNRVAGGLSALNILSTCLFTDQHFAS